VKDDDGATGHHSEAYYFRLAESSEKLESATFFVVSAHRLTAVNCRLSGLIQRPMEDSYSLAVAAPDNCEVAPKRLSNA
jgi:hypothetical protein